MDHIYDKYAFNCDLGGSSKLLFKPTLGSENAFRSNVDEFLSYFAGDGVCTEDHGFAIKPWTSIRFDVHGVFIKDGVAIVIRSVSWCRILAVTQNFI